MKKLFKIALAFVFAIIVTEFVIQYILDYPKYGVEKSILGVPYSGKELIYTPYSKYWTVEGGNKVYKRNNIGLQGSDVNVSPSSKYVFVLGNSFIKASEVAPELIATSVFQKKLEEINKEFQVLNLGYYSHDPYQLWFLSNYFKDRYPPSAVILVIERDYALWLSGYHHPLTFTLPGNFGAEDNGISFKFFSLIRNKSALVNLLAGALKISGIDKAPIKEEEVSKNETLMTPGVNEPPEDLLSTASEFKNTYGNKFILFSMMPDEKMNKELMNFCEKNDINCEVSSDIIIPANRLNQSGHLNEKGNRKLGEKLYESFEKFIYKNK